MSSVADSVSKFPAEPRFEGRLGHDLSRVLEATPQKWDEAGFTSFALSFPNEAGQQAATQLPNLAQVAPAVLNAFISGFDSRNAETRRLNERILALEQIQSELLDENAELASVLEAAELVELTAEDFWDEEALASTSPSVPDNENQHSSTEIDTMPLLAPGVVNAFVCGFESRGSETSRLNKKIATLEEIKADLLDEIAVLAGALEASNRLAIGAPEARSSLVDDADSRNVETTRLNEIIAALEQAKSDLLVENAALASALEATSPVAVPTPEVMEDEAFLSNFRSFASEAGHDTSEPTSVLGQGAPAFLEDFIGGLDPWDSETSRLNDRIAILEQANSDLHIKNTALASALDSSSRVAAQTPEIPDKAVFPANSRSSALAESLNTSAPPCSQPQMVPSGLEILIECVESRDSEINRLHDEIMALEQTKSDLLVQNAVLASALEAPNIGLEGASEITAAEDLFSTPRSSTNQASQDTWTQFQPQAQDAPADLDAFIFGFESRDTETRRLNEQIGALEQAKADLVAENALLASTLAASQPIVAPAREVPDDEGFFSIPQPFADEEWHVASRQFRARAREAQPVVYDFTDAIDSGRPETKESSGGVVIFEPTQSNLLVGYAMRARALRASRHKSNFASLLIALGGCLAGLGIHLLGAQFDGRQTGFAVIAIGAGLGLMNFGWFYRPVGA